MARKLTETRANMGLAVGRCKRWHDPAARALLCAAHSGPAAKRASNPLRDAVQSGMMAVAMLRVGFVGAGTMASAHLAALRLVPEVAITAFADPVVERAQERAAQFGGAAMT